MLFRLHYYLILLLLCWQSASGSTYTKPGTVNDINNPNNTGGIYKVFNTSHFSIRCNSELKNDEKISSLLELAYFHFQSIFCNCDFELKMPAEKLRWITFNSKDAFNSYALKTENQDLSWLNGYYSARTNIVAIVSPGSQSKWQIQPENMQAINIIACPPDAESDLAKIVHEAAHQLSFNTGLLKRTVIYPFWVSEGLATYFEQSMFSEYFKSSKYATIRQKGLSAFYSQDNLISLDKFISMTQLDESVSAVDAYAQAWGFFRFLLEHDKDSLKKYLSRLYKNEENRIDEQALNKEFIDSFGTPDQINRQWMLFLDKLAL